MTIIKKSLLSVAVLVAMQSSASAAFFLTPTVSSSAKTDIQYGDTVKTNKVGVTLGNEYVYGGVALRSYDFSNKEDIDAKDLFVGGQYSDKFNNRFGFLVGGKFGFSWDEEFSASDSYNLNAYGALTYSVGNGFTLIGGAGAYLTNPKNFFYPVLGAKYREQTDRGLSFGVGFPSNNVTYRFNDSFAVIAKLDLYKSEPFVYLENYANSKQDFYLLDRSNEASIAAEFNLSRNFTLNAGVAYTFDRKLKIYDEDGHKLASYEADDDGRVFVSGRFTF